MVEGIEVIVSRVQVPPNAELPRHWHPGEEFGYVIDGEVSLWLEGEVTRTDRARRHLTGQAM